ncbi:MAG: hypothetical protein ACPGWR_30585, partial [Ardenticatenaceae bacterium]
EQAGMRVLPSHEQARGEGELWVKLSTNPFSPSPTLPLRPFSHFSTLPLSDSPTLPLFHSLTHPLSHSGQPPGIAPTVNETL